MTITPPRSERYGPSVALVESITQCWTGTPLAVNVLGPAVVLMKPPSSMKTGSPVGALYPGHAERGSGNSLPLYVRSGTVLPFPGHMTGVVNMPEAKLLPRMTSSAAAASQPLLTSRYD